MILKNKKYIANVVQTNSIFEQVDIESVHTNNNNNNISGNINQNIDIEDLIDAHLLALDYLCKGGSTEYFNLGTNNGYTVKEVFDFCEKITNKQINVKLMPRRDGDPAKLIAKNEKASQILNWIPQRKLENSVKNAYLWEKKMHLQLD